MTNGCVFFVGRRGISRRVHVNAIYCADSESRGSYLRRAHGYFSSSLCRPAVAHGRRTFLIPTFRASLTSFHTYDLRFWCYTSSLLLLLLLLLSHETRPSLRHFPLVVTARLLSIRPSCRSVCFATILHLDTCVFFPSMPPRTYNYSIASRFLRITIG